MYIYCNRQSWCVIMFWTFSAMFYFSMVALGRQKSNLLGKYFQDSLGQLGEVISLIMSNLWNKVLGNHSWKGCTNRVIYISLVDFTIFSSRSVFQHLRKRWVWWFRNLKSSRGRQQNEQRWRWRWQLRRLPGCRRLWNWKRKRWTKWRNWLGTFSTSERKSKDSF